MKRQILHVVVGATTEAMSNIPFRRDRFVDYLSRQPSSSEIFWVHAVRRTQQVDAVSAQPLWLSTKSGTAPVRGCPVSIPRKLVAYSHHLQGPSTASLMRQIRDHPAPVKLLWYTVPALSSLATACEWNGIVYDCSDNWTARDDGGGISVRLHAGLRARSERRIVRSSGLLFATSEFLVRRIRSEYNRDAELVENGVDFESFQRAPRRPLPIVRHAPGQITLGFVGALKPYKIDFDLLYDVAKSNPGWRIVLIGPVPSTALRDSGLQQLRSLDNVDLLGAQPLEVIPSYMKSLDVGLLPYREVPYNSGVFPLKFFEYLAAGLPVVGSGLPSTSKYVEPGVYHLVSARSDVFRKACCDALLSRNASARRLAYARNADWKEIFARMVYVTFRAFGLQPDSEVPEHGGAPGRG